MDVRGSWRLMTVNTAPERAKQVIGRVTEALKGRYEIEHIFNCTTIDQVEDCMREYTPNLLFCASMWSPEQRSTVEKTARSIVPDILFYAVPQGLQAREGPDGVVNHLVQHLPALLGDGDL